MIEPSEAVELAGQLACQLRYDVRLGGGKLLSHDRNEFELFFCHERTA